MRYLHGETESSIYGDEEINNVNVTHHHAITNNVGSSTTFAQMVYDAAGPQFNANIVEESPNPTTQNFYDMLNAANQEVWPSCQTHSQLSSIARILHIKSEHRLFERCYDALCQFMKELLSDDNVMTNSFYETKKLIEGIGLQVYKIHTCLNGCMIYWGDDSKLTQ